MMLALPVESEINCVRIIDFGLAFVSDEVRLHNLLKHRITHVNSLRNNSY